MPLSITFYWQEGATKPTWLQRQMWYMKAPYSLFHTAVGLYNYLYVFIINEHTSMQILEFHVSANNINLFNFLLINFTKLIWINSSSISSGNFLNLWNSEHNYFFNTHAWYSVTIKLLSALKNQCIYVLQDKSFIHSLMNISPINSFTVAPSL
jgi:hypothetical protein